ncbi:MAG: PCRF domain-containing protein, partial [Clostridia bacterium]|nr:PCRF domain-containing protein [Clostridia bacterium]
MLDLQQYTQDLTALRKTLVEAGEALHIEHLKETLEELTEEMNQPEFWNDADHANKINQKVGTLRAKIEHYEGLLSLADDIEVAMEMAEDEQDEAMVDEAGSMLTDLKEKTAVLELETLMRGQYDDSNAILSLHAGAGGTEAQDWTQMLYRMYTRFCEQMGFTVKVLDFLDGDEAGIKSVTFEVSGDHAYGYLRGEKGVHRLVRISPFDSNARR